LALKKLSLLRPTRPPPPPMLPSTSRLFHVQNVACFKYFIHSCLIPVLMIMIQIAFTVG
jgi:hypothetical protein